MAGRPIDQAFEFFMQIFGETVGKDARLSIFTLPGQVSRRFEIVGEAAQYAVDNIDRDVYFGLSLVAGNPSGRGTLGDMAGIGGLWADIDVAGPGHKKKGLPSSIQQAREKILDRLGLPPTLTVWSGHGLQCYWLFQEPWLWHAGGMAQAKKLSERWGQTIRFRAAEAGLEVDSVFDLTRVFRVPGTFNRKDPDNPIAVKVIEFHDDRRYDPESFDDYLIDVEATTEARAATEVEAVPATVSDDEIILDPAAEPPFDLFSALMDNDAKFKKTWDKKRTDLPSQSEHDASLACISAACGWTTQQTVNLIIAHRRKHGEPIDKALRLDYMKRTVGRAQRLMKQERAITGLANTVEGLPTDSTKDSDERQELLGTLSESLGVQIVRFLQHGEENARYSLWLKDGRQVRLGSAGNIVASEQFRIKLLEATGILIKSFKKHDWDNACRVFMAAREVVENEETTSAYQAEQWIRGYLEQYPAADGDNWKEAAKISSAFVRDGRLHLSASELRKHMKMIQGESRVTHPELCDCLRVSGFERVVVNAWIDGRQYGRSYWARAVKEIDDESEGREEGGGVPF